MKTKIASLLLAGLFLTAGLLAQAPNSFHYQAMLRKNDGTALLNQNVSMRISILKGSLTGISVYTEVQSVMTNSFGIMDLNVGEGIVQSGAFNTIDWSLSVYFMKIEVDLTGGTNYTLLGVNQLLSVPYAIFAQKAGNGFSGDYNDLSNKPVIPGNTNELVNGAGYITDYTETDPVFSASLASKIKAEDTLRWHNKSDFSGSYNDLTNKPVIPANLSQLTLNAGNQVISNLSSPINNTDAVNRRYVDSIFTLTQVLVNGVTDYEGNHYNTRLIGSQIWMTENLRVAHYREGTLIPNITTAGSWAALSDGARCYYLNDSLSYDEVYGTLYNWYAVTDSRNLCPTGWHVPSDAEYNTMVTYLGGSGSAGGKLKEIGLNHWYTPNASASNQSGFTGLPGGIRSSTGLYSLIYKEGYYWTSVAFSSPNAYALRLIYSSGSSSNTNYNKLGGYSVRCLRD